MSIAGQQMKNNVMQQIASVRKETAVMASSTDEQRNGLLESIADGLVRDSKAIFEANLQDMANATDCAASVRDRLKFGQEKFNSVIRSLSDVAALSDPIGKVLLRTELDDNLLLEKISVPIGVIGMVFEARPDALVQIVSLCIKSGNCIVLKGGKEAALTNKALFDSIQRSCEGSFAGTGWILLLQSHEDVNQMLKADGLIDLMIPRGTYAFVKYVKDNTRIPVLGHADGLCTMYIDRSAFVGKAVACALDAKTNYPAACNSIENLLVHKDISSEFLPIMAKAYSENGVSIVGDKRVCKIIGCPEATENDWDTEYLSLKISIRIVDSLDEAIAFIAAHTSHHTDAIIAEDEQAVRKFQTLVDSADVFANCSTRFADGYRFGLGAELGVSTSRIHARGPVGIEGLMTTKYLLSGQGQIVGTYMGPNAKGFKHIDLGTEGPSRILSDSDEDSEDAQP